MKRTLLLATYILFGPLAIVYADTPESFLNNLWYNIEFVVFEKITPDPTTELVVNAVEKREFPSNIIGMRMSERESERIAQTSGAVPFHDVVDDFFFENPWHKPPKTDSSKLNEKTTYSEDSTRDSCWLHWGSPEEEDSKANDLSERIAALFGKPKKRDPRLPSWLPDKWQTFEQNFIDAIVSLGLCEEDVSPLFDERFLDFMGQNITNNEVQQSIDSAESVTEAMVRQAFSDYEHDLTMTALTPQSKSLNLSQTASDLQRNGYHIIDHIAWHQAGLERGREANLLVQFGEPFSNGLREVEGTVSFSVARFLHLVVELWRFVDEPQNYDPETTRFSSPLFFYELKESRRLALGELHYLDHPKFGLLVQIRRVPIPQHLRELAEQLDGSS